MRNLTSNGHHCPVATFKSARRRVFCASLADVFDNEVDPQWRADLLSLIEQTPNLDWLLLTKRIGNVMPMLKALRDSEASTTRWRFVDRWLNGKPPEHVWLGSTIGYQAEADRDIPKLLATPAHVRFLSMEPLLGSVDLTAIEIRLSGTSHEVVNVLHQKDGLNLGLARPSIDWVIVGGESGHGARPMHPEWARAIRDQCESAGVPYLFKQWGNWAIDEQSDVGRDGSALLPNPRRLRLRIDGQAAEPGAIESNDGTAMTNIGKRLAGRELDGLTHNGYPAAKPYI
jgi:Bacteriophage protein gp37